MINLFRRDMQTENAPQDTVVLDGKAVLVSIKRNSRAKRLILRLDPGRESAVVVTLPPRVPVSEAFDMVERKKDWILPRLIGGPKTIPFAPNATIPLEGENRQIMHHPDQRGTVWLTQGGINVAGGEDHLQRRLIDWLKERAREKLTEQVQIFTDKLNVKGGRISIRDTRSRWGSCSATGNLSFSWRLILAPPEALAYVTAHEVAHLKEMNHSPRYWALVKELYPEYEIQRRWLKENGPRLQRYGKK